MNMTSQAFYEEIVFRAGMQVCGGNLSLLPHADPVSGEAAGNAAWAGRGMGLFVVDYPSLLGPDDRDQIALAYGSNLARLRDAKQRFDPHGLFSATPLPV